MEAATIHDPKTRPIIYLAFAQDSGDFLPQLERERDTILEALEEATSAGLCEVIVDMRVTVDKVLSTFQRHRDRIALFHFGGHAGEDRLMVRGENGRMTTLHAGGLASMWRQQQGLKVAFLNGCSTRGQVEGLLQAGVEAVIATKHPVDDEAAAVFARHFYQGLATQATLKVAFEEAKSALKAHFTIPVAINLRDLEEESEPWVGSWPWELHLQRARAASWNLIKAADDPLFGLPNLPGDIGLPAKPFKHLAPFSRQDARIYFGRGWVLRELHDQLTREGAPSITLLYGPAGTGKTSLLKSGLLPRCEEAFDTAMASRSRLLGMTRTFERLLGVAPEESATEAWRGRTGQSDKPLLMVLDQVEEIFTQKFIEDGEGEMAGFMSEIYDLFSEPRRRPSGHLILAFRKEWLAEILTQFDGFGLEYNLVEITPLSRPEIIEIIEGPSQDPELSDHFKLDLEPALSVIIADDLLEDRDAAIAPSLQLLLTSLWEKAHGLDPDNPTFTIEMYQDLRKSGILLSDFVARQLATLQTWRPWVVSTGLALDLLAFHTNPFGSARRREARELADRYAHQREILPEFLERLAGLYLISGSLRLDEDPPTGSTRIAHDSLGPIIRRLYDTSNAPGQRAARLLDQRISQWKGGGEGAAFDDMDLAVVERGQLGMKAWNEDEQRLVDASRMDRDTRARKKRMTIVALISLAALSFIVAVLAFLSGSSAIREKQEAEQKTLIAVKNYEEANRQRQLAEEARKKTLQALTLAKVHDLAFRAGTLLGEHNHELATLTARQAARFDARTGNTALTEVVSAARATLAHPIPPRRLHRGNGQPTHRVAFSPDGRWLAAVGRDRLLHLWHMRKTNEAPLNFPIEQETRSGDNDDVLAMAFSPDSVSVALGCEDGALRTFNLDTRAWTLRQGHQDTITDLAFSPDGRWLATTGTDGALKLYPSNNPDAPPITATRDTALLDLAFHPESKHIAIIPAGSPVEILHIDTHEQALAPLKSLVQEGPRFVRARSLAFSPDGDTLALGLRSGATHLVDWAASVPTHRPLTHTHTGAVLSIDFSPSGESLAASGQDGTILFWQVKNLESPPLRINAHPTPVRSVAFDPREKWLASGNKEGRVTLWALGLGAGDPLVLHAPGSPVTSAHFSPEADALTITAHGQPPLVFKAPLKQGANPRPLALEGLNIKATRLAASADGKRIALATRRGSLHVFDKGAEGWKSIAKTTLEASIRALDMSPDGHTIAYATGVSHDTSEWLVTLWAPEDGQTKRTLPDKRAAALSLDFNHTGRRLAFAGYGGYTAVREIRGDLDPIFETAPLKYATTEVAFSPDGNWLGTAHLDHHARIWDMRSNGKVPTREMVVNQPLSTMAFSPNGQWLAVGGRNGLAALWNWQSPDEQLLHLKADDQTSRISTLAFTHDGKHIATAGRGGKIRIWLTPHAAIDRLCERITRNMTLREWRAIVGDEFPYERTCPILPIHPSVIEEAVEIARARNLKDALRIFAEGSLRNHARARLRAALSITPTPRSKR